MESAENIAFYILMLQTLWIKFTHILRSDKTDVAFPYKGNVIAKIATPIRFYNVYKNKISPLGLNDIEVIHKS
jgi:hypothetical protein